MDTLCLDVSYQPRQAVAWETAIVWVLEKIVEVVEEHPDRYIRTPSWSVKMPSVVRFLKPIPRRKAIKFSRSNVFARDGGRCQYCSRKVPRHDFTYDHVVPRAQGDKTEWSNVAISCSPCNQRKGGRTPAQAGMSLRSEPVRPKKLPDFYSAMTYRKGMPENWKSWLRDAVYWNGELENDCEK